MRRFVFLLVTACVCTVRAQECASVEDVFRIFRYAKAVDLSDEAIADQLAICKPTQQITDQSIQVLKHLGAGPLTIEALEQLRAKSASLPLAPRPIASLTPAPDAAQLKEEIGRIVDYASGYVHALPNFLCSQTTLFYKSGHLSKETRANGLTEKVNWRLDQKVVEDLRYHDGAEDYQTRLINDKPNTAPVTEIRSFYTRGEFGSILSGTFDPSSQAEYDWDHWEMVNGKQVAVIGYEVARARSGYRVCCVSLGAVTINGVRRQRRKEEATGYRGLIYADPDTGIIEMLTLENIDIPAELGLDDAKNLLEYRPTTLGGKTTWLPVKAIHYSRQGSYRTRSEIEFSHFRSFGANSTIQFPTEDDPKP